MGKTATVRRVLSVGDEPETCTVCRAYLEADTRILREAGKGATGRASPGVCIVLGIPRSGRASSGPQLLQQ
ncbi:MAG: hypothetical protein CSA58_10845 [Micrococcales bacterium]|nr:MAG: hypothetical protein CSB46_07755 [Micrococcales bacterium]PIE26180.1 MAG: hypothetical protein CSA58_10845 [Micrococcales bacterium]